MEGINNEEQTSHEVSLIPDLEKVMSNPGFKFSEVFKAVKDWVYRAPSLDNAMLTIQLEYRSEGFQIIASLWEQSGNDILEDSDSRITDGRGQTIETFSSGHLMAKADRFLSGFSLEKAGKRHPLVLEES